MDANKAEEIARKIIHYLELTTDVQTWENSVKHQIVGAIIAILLNEN